MSAATATSQGLPQRQRSRARSMAATVLREVWAMLKAPANLRGDLLRMADECEASRPEQAARLRKIAVSPWSE